MTLLTNSGSLISGTYQFSYRFIRQVEYNSSGDKFYDYKDSKWTLATAPVFISDKIDSLAIGDGQIGRSSDTRIRITINATTEEQAYYDYYQISVLRRLDGQNLPPTEAFVYEPVAFSTFPDTFEVGSNYEFVEVPVSDIVIDNAPVETFKTLTQRNNIMLPANIKYYDRDIGDSWTFSDTTVDNIAKDIGISYDPTQPAGSQGYSDALVSHRYVGHFRDEVYRYTISYVDKYGNWSPAKVFNFNSSTNNSISDSTAIDWKFPTRDTDGYTLFDSSGNIQALGLSIPNIDNHPTWAVGFSILRAKRKENIIFQTPLVPLSLVQPAIANTETNAWDKFPSSDGDALADPNGTLIPKDFRRHNVTQSSERTASGDSGDWADQSIDDPETFAHIIFPVSMMYQNGTDVIDTFDDNSIKNLTIVDSAGLKFHTGNFTDSPVGSPGKYRNETHTMYASQGSQYYYEDGQSGKAKLDTITGFDYGDIRVLEFGYIENFSDKYTIRTSVENLSAPSVGGYNDLRIAASNDSSADNMRSGVVVTNKGLRDPSYETLVSAGDIQYDLNGTPAGIPATSGGTADSTIVASVLIVNATADLSDARYGDETDFNEYIPTQFEKTGSNSLSSTYMFTPVELTTVQAGTTTPISVDVWGGDCFISRHNFKISDGTVRLTGDDGITYVGSDQTRADDIASYWGSEYGVTDSSGTGEYSMPVGVEGYSQIIELYLESKVNADVIQRDTCQTAGSNFSLIENSSFEIRTPFDYNYMLSYSLENGLKVFFSDDVLDRDSNAFNSRILYSKTRLINTNLEGFDEYPVSNTYDLEDRYGGVTKIITFSNRVYSLQESSFSYIPVQARVIETDVNTDQLAVRSSQTIDLHQSVSVTLGCQHMKTVKLSDSDLYFTDVDKKKIVKFSDNTSVISEQNLGTYFDDKLSSSIEEKDLHCFYDLSRYKFHITKSYNGTGWSVIWNDKFGKWESELDIQATFNPLEFFYSYPDTYSIGLNNLGNLVVEKLYTQGASTWFGTTVVPRITYVSIPTEGLPSTFDTTSIDSTQRLDTFKMTIPRDANLGDYYTDELELEGDPREGVYKIKILRNVNSSAAEYTSVRTESSAADRAGRSGQRMRGTFAETELKWNTGSFLSNALSSVFTKYRPSRRQF
jgi:hypothetical protein